MPETTTDPPAGPTPSSGIPGLSRLALAAHLPDPAAAERSFPAAFAEQVRESGQLLAVQDTSQRLTYAELDDRAGRIAAALEGAGGPADRPVLVLARHGVPAVAALVGVAMSGRPYVALDPTAPDAARRRGARRFPGSAVVTDRDHAAAADRLGGSGPVLVWEALPPGAAPTPDIEPDAPLLVSWTSGSTGAPKGVVHSHRSVLHNALRVGQAFDVRPADRLLVASPFAFVASATPVFTALAAGAAVCPYGLAVQGVDGFGAFALDVGLTIAQLSPAHVRAICDEVHRVGTVPSLRLVIIGGDRLEPFHVERLASAFPNARVVHRYSTSETNWIAGAEVDVARCPDLGPVPLGWPVPWLAVDVVDEEGWSVAADGTGQVVVEGDALALRYWQDPERTAARFTPGTGARQPHGDDRRFATGDTVRRQADGLLAFIGRGDRAVKVNGVLVDLVTVEQAVRDVAGVTQAAVVTWDAGDGATRIAAFVVMDREGQERTGAAIRRDVAVDLPQSMVPATVGIVRELPVTVRGKVDHVALEARASRMGRAPYVAPADPREEQVTALFARVLGIERVGRDDDFYDLGADSLDTMALVVGLQSQLGIDADPAMVLRHPTPAALVAASEAPGARAAWRGHLIRVVHGPDGPTPVVLCPGGGGGEIELMSALGRAIGDRTAYVTVPRGFVRRAAPDRSIVAMAAAVVRDVLAETDQAPVALAGYSSGGMVVFEAARQLRAAGVTVPVVVLVDTSAPEPAGARIRRRIGGRLAATRARRLPMARRPYAYARAMLRPRRWWWELTAGVVPRTGRDQWDSFAVVREHALDWYRPGRYDGDVVLLRAADQEGVAKRTGDMSGWSAFLDRPARVVDIQGRHSTVLRPPFLECSAGTIRGVLAQVDADRAPEGSARS